MSFFKGKRIAVTGAGSLGSALAYRIIKQEPEVLRILDNHEMQLEKLRSELGEPRNIRYLLGDIRDKERLVRAFEDIDIVVHTAALKIVEFSEYDPKEFLETDVYGTQNVVEASLADNVWKLCLVSSDKACLALNAYGRAKALAERLVTASNFYRGSKRTRAFCVRYGNVLGSQGSVLCKWLEQKERGEPLTLVDAEMTRFNVTMNQALEFIERSLEVARGGEIFIPKLKSYDLKDLLKAFIDVQKRGLNVKTIPMRPGEKLHEILVNEYEMAECIDIGCDYVILPDEELRRRFNLHYYFDVVKNPEMKRYSSDEAERLNVEELKRLIEEWLK